MKPDATHRMVDENEVLDIYGWFPVKLLTKTAVSRGGGIAARFTPADDPFDYVSPAKPARKVRARIVSRQTGKPAPMNEPDVANTVANPVANVANKPRYARWREKNPDLYKERQAKYQADYRARKAQAANPD